MKKLIFIILVLLLVFFGCKTDSSSDADDDDKARFRITGHHFTGVDLDLDCAKDIIDFCGGIENCSAGILRQIWIECSVDLNDENVCDFPELFFLELAIQNPDKDTIGVFYQAWFDPNGELLPGPKEYMGDIEWSDPDYIQEINENIVGALSIDMFEEYEFMPVSFDLWLVREPEQFEPVYSEIYSIDNIFSACLFDDLPPTSDQEIRTRSFIKRLPPVQQ